MKTLALVSVIAVAVSCTLSFGQNNTSLNDRRAIDQSILCPPYCGFKKLHFKTYNSQLLDPCGEPVVLRGVNKMAVFDNNDAFGQRYFTEIGKTKANCVRIAWEMRSELNGRTQENSLARLDSLITNAKRNQLIPIVGLWDYTNTEDGGFSKLNEYVDYWTKPAMLKLILKHQTGLILNIANEAAKSENNGGNETVLADLNVYADGYKTAIVKLRAKGIKVPIMIDGMDRGKSLHCFAVKGPEILQADPDKNVIFSFHAYWPRWATDADPGFIQTKFAEVSSLGIPIVIGEVSKYGAWTGSAATSVCSERGMVDYRQFVEQANAAGMGWLIWEWGPGNQWKVPGDCPQMNMTTNGTVATLGMTQENAWAKELTTDRTVSYGIENTAQKTFFIKSGLKACNVD